MGTNCEQRKSMPSKSVGMGREDLLRSYNETGWGIPGWKPRPTNHEQPVGMNREDMIESFQRTGWGAEDGGYLRSK